MCFSRLGESRRASILAELYGDNLTSRYAKFQLSNFETEGGDRGDR